MSDGQQPNGPITESGCLILSIVVVLCATAILLALILH